MRAAAAGLIPTDFFLRGWIEFREVLVMTAGGEPLNQDVRDTCAGWEHAAMGDHRESGLRASKFLDSWLIFWKVLAGHDRDH
ncbi:hypothetical protein TcasGA2_TC009088 [Tribolium castaneum]|uniref:Uncharacterized protein n=1 Tax=Tribolium castaneum TaxID=7070 RepID=D6WP91_TRICA|nr:hypothetical protein TcasGA2_TC009088 [Tribolium castaneum]